MCFLEDTYKQMQKIQILKFLRVPSIWNLAVCLWKDSLKMSPLKMYFALLDSDISVYSQKSIKMSYMYQGAFQIAGMAHSSLKCP